MERKKGGRLAKRLTAWLWFLSERRRTTGERGSLVDLDREREGQGFGGGFGDC